MNKHLHHTTLPVPRVLPVPLVVRNEIISVNTLAKQIINNSLSVINWKLSELENLDWKSRKLLFVFQTHHSLVNVDKICLLCTHEGQGLIQIENYYKLTTVDITKIVRSK